MTAGPYAEPRVVTDPSECFFYHTMDIPGHGLVNGISDLRGKEDVYLGRVDFRGKRVLEVGTAGGFLCFHMERSGAEVVAYDLSPEHSWDIVPFAMLDHDALAERMPAGIRSLNNAWWFAHRAFESKARVVYGRVYDIPSSIGPVDYTTFCQTLVHFRDPLAALTAAARLTREKIIVADVLGRRGLLYHLLSYLPFVQPCLHFRPNYLAAQSWNWDMDAVWANVRDLLTWHYILPKLLRQYLGVLGFERTHIEYHRTSCVDFRGGSAIGYTLVAERTRDMKPLR